MYKTAITLGAAFAGLGVVLGAFGAHALKKILAPEQLVSFETGVRYQMYHSFALILAGILFHLVPSGQLRMAVIFFTVGIVLFSGSIYALTLLKAKGAVGLGGVGILTPIGGVFFILGWIMLLVGALKLKG